MSKIKVKPILICFGRGAQESVLQTSGGGGGGGWSGGVVGGEYFAVCKIKQYELT